MKKFFTLVFATMLAGNMMAQMAYALTLLVLHLLMFPL